MNKSEIKVLYNQEEILNGIELLAKKINQDYENEELCLICVLKGAVMFMTDLAKNLSMPVKMEFTRVSSYGSDTVTSGQVKAINMELPDLNWKNVLIVEDIIDSGHTAKFLIDYIKNKFDTKSLKFCSLLDKKSRREVDISADYYVFDVEDKFLVGYGLDYNGEYRNLPYIGYLEF